MPPEPSVSIFISHTNGDELAQRVLDALLAAGAPQGLQFVVDYNNIAVGEHWRQRVYEWLENSPAAVLLISPGCFGPGKTWVKQEAFYLTVRGSQRGNLLIIPVTVGDVAQRLKTEPDFEPALLSEIKWIPCPDPYDQEALARVIEQIRTALASLRPNERGALTGLAKDIEQILTVHPDAHAALAAALASPLPSANAKALAVRLLETDEKHMAAAVKAFATYAAAARGGAGPDPCSKLCRLLSAREVPDQAARLLALEMAKSPSEARAVLINRTDDEVSELYVVRAAGCSDHGWPMLGVNFVLELGAADSARAALAKTVQTKLLSPGVREGDKAAAKAVAVAKTMRRLGQPALFLADITDVGEGVALIEAVRNEVPYCGLLLRSESAPALVDPWPAGAIRKLEPELDDIQWERLVGLKGALDYICMQPWQS